MYVNYSKSDPRLNFTVLFFEELAKLSDIEGGHGVRRTSILSDVSLTHTLCRQFCILCENINVLIFLVNFQLKPISIIKE